MRVSPVLLALLLAGCVEHHNIASQTDDEHYLSFSEVHCLPDVFAGEPVERGKIVDCVFVVEGVAQTDVSLTCEDDGGEAVECFDPEGVVYLDVDTDFPDDFNPPVSPQARCRFVLRSGEVEGDTFEPVVWVATNGEHTIRKRFAPTLIPDDSVDEPPDIWVDCLPPAPSNVLRGARVNCLVFAHDPDPGARFDWAATLVANPGGPSGPLDFFPPNPVHGPGILLWTWNVGPDLPAGTWTWEFRIAHTDIVDEVNFVLP